jgi:hypothetical protein
VQGLDCSELESFSTHPPSPGNFTHTDGPTYASLERSCPHSRPRRPNTAPPHVDLAPSLMARLIPGTTRPGPHPHRPGPLQRPGPRSSTAGPHGSASPGPAPPLCPDCSWLVQPDRPLTIDLWSGPQGPAEVAELRARRTQGVLWVATRNTGATQPIPVGRQRSGLGRAPGLKRRAGHAWKLNIKQLHTMSRLCRCSYDLDNENLDNENKFTVKIPNNLLRLNRDEYLTLNVMDFIVIIHVLIV